MMQKKILHIWLTAVQLLAVPFLVYSSFYWRYASALVTTQGYLEAMRRGLVSMEWYLLKPRNLIIFFTLLPLLVLWLKSSGKRRWRYYGAIVFLSVFYAWLDEVIYSSYTHISLMRQIVPWVIWALVMAFLFWREFRSKGQKETPEQAAPASSADIPTRT